MLKANDQNDSQLDPIFVSPKTTARILDRGLTHINALIKAGTLRSIKSGRRRQVVLASVREHAANELKAAGA